jgi:hypothetical protein
MRQNANWLVVRGLCNPLNLPAQWGFVPLTAKDAAYAAKALTFAYGCCPFDQKQSLFGLHKMVAGLLVLLSVGWWMPVWALSPEGLRNGFVDRSETTPTVVYEARRTVTLVKGQPLLVQLETPIDTSVNQVGDPIEASLVQDLYLYQEKLLPRLTRFYGTINQLDIPYAGRNPILRLTFDHYQLPNGQRLPLQAVVRSTRPDHLFGGELTPGTQPKLVRHGVWGIGYYNQVIMSGPRQRGTPLTFDPGSMQVLLLEQPLTLPHVTPWVQYTPHQPWP